MSLDRQIRGRWGPWSWGGSWQLGRAEGWVQSGGQGRAQGMMEDKPRL